MGIEDGTTQYTLKHSFEYYDKEAPGNESHASFIELREPEFSHSKWAYKLQQYQSRLMDEMISKQEKEDVEKAVQEKGSFEKPLEERVEEVEESIKQLESFIEIGLKTSDKIEIDEFVNTFVDMCCCESAKRNIAMIDGRYALRRAHIQRMSLQDLLACAIKWTAFFIMSQQTEN